VKKHYKSLIVFLLITTISFSQIPSYVPSNGLVGWWPFNGTANDESGNGNNGQIVNLSNAITFSSDRFNNSLNAVKFNSQSVSPDIAPYINIIGTNNLVLIDYSINIWSKIEMNSQVAELVNRGPDNNSFFSRFQGLNGIAFGNSPSYLNHTMPIDTTQWHMYTFSRGSNGVGYLYYDGNLLLSQSISAIPNNGNNFVFGKMPSGGTNGSYYPFQGKLDDIGIWNRALTECEIKDLYYAQLGYSTVDAGADQTICRGDLVTLQGSGGSSLAWDNGVIDGVPFEPAQSGAYVLTGADSLGCIGTDTVQVTVLENASSTINQTAIDSYTLNGQTYTQSGTYTQVVPAANGCDSVITLNLELDFTGIQSHTNTSLHLYPNPVKDVMTLVGLKGDAVSFAVYSVDGKLIKSGQTSGEIQLEDLEKGNYILKIENEALPFVKL
jgi:hypothetical protein